VPLAVTPVTNELAVEAVHGQPAVVLTVNEPLEDPAPTDALVGDSE
jgi:hypothetical protein